MKTIYNEQPPHEDHEPVLNEYKVRVLATQMLTHNVKRFTLEKPEDYTFTPGQATDLAINQPGFRSEFRPFTITSLNSDPSLEFIIKIYKGHHGITEQLEKVSAGDELILHEVFGTLTYRGPGLFIAGGAGITPFISIFRQLEKHNQISGCTLLFANRSAEDIILGDELTQMLGKNYADLLEISNNPESPGGFITAGILTKYTKPENQYYYICGPDKFVSTITGHLIGLGVCKSQIIIEE